MRPQGPPMIVRAFDREEDGAPTREGYAGRISTSRWLRAGMLRVRT